jgi:CheY-like chemotaxis protein
MPRILIAEDEPDIRELVALILELDGHEVIQARDGQEAVEKAQAEHPDLILMGVRMPRMTGYEACETLKANPATQHIPVVFLSAKGQESEVKEGLAAGAVDYILKPFSPDQLTARVAELLQQFARG